MPFVSLSRFVSLWILDEGIVIDHTWLVRWEYLLDGMYLLARMGFNFMLLECLSDWDDCTGYDWDGMNR